MKIPFWATFRVPTSINFIASYSVPPFTTIYGMIMNALGKFQDVYGYYNKFSIAIEVQSMGERIWDLVSYMKTADPKSSIVRKKDLKKIQDGDTKLEQEKIKELVEKQGLSEEEAKSLIEQGNAIYHVDFKGIYYTQALQCERIVRPEYKIYLKTNDGDLSQGILNALQNPERPLYLGQSDDFVVIQNLDMIKDPKKLELDKTSTIYKGILENCEIVNLPEYFEKSGRYLNCVTSNYSVFTGTRDLKKKIEGYKIENHYVIFS